MYTVTMENKEYFYRILNDLKYNDVKYLIVDQYKLERN